MASTEDNDQAYEEAMDDVHTRFILNLPDEELQSAPRIFFQLEQAWWFYDDFLCDGAAAAAATAAAEAEGGGGKKKGKKKKKKPTAVDEPLPRFKHMKPFSLAMFGFSDLLRPMLPRFEAMYGEFAAYKRVISTYGTILLNDDATEVALCRVYNGKAWTLPGGKVNQHESGRDAAARETYEETGFDPDAELGASARWAAPKGGTAAADASPPPGPARDVDAPSDEDDGGAPTSSTPALPWTPLRDVDTLVYTENDTRKRRTCYVCRGVPPAFPFRPVARKEVAEVAWHALDDLPRHTYAVLPFVAGLRRWIKKDNRRREGRGGSRGRARAGSGAGSSRAATPATSSRGDSEAGLTPFFTDGGDAPWEGTPAGSVEGGGDENGGAAPTPPRKKEKKEKRRKDKRPGSRGSAGSSRAGSRGRRAAPAVGASDSLVASALAAPGDPARWTEAEMFAANEQLLGRGIAYDGNPHDFAEKGFAVGAGAGEGGGRVDPHTFRVVGGTFMNAGAAGGGGMVPPPAPGTLQPLVHAGHGAGGAADPAFTPFFSDDGRAPWEEGGEGAPAGPVTPPAVQGAGRPAGRSNSKGLALLRRLRQGSEGGGADAGAVDREAASATRGGEREDAARGGEGHGAEDAADWFLTDGEITAHSQREKLSILPPSLFPAPSLPATVPPTPPAPAGGGCREGEHRTWMKQWVQRLPVTGATPEFGNFRLDADAIVNAMVQ